jgi:hypothetical protein
VVAGTATETVPQQGKQLNEENEENEEDKENIYLDVM